MSDRLHTFSSSTAPEVVAGTATSDNFSVVVNPPIALSKKLDYSIALWMLDSWNSVFNIKAAFGNNLISYSYNGGANWVDIVIPDGNYEIADLQKLLHQTMLDNNHYNSTNPAAPSYYINLLPIIAEGKLRIEVSNSYQLDLSNGTLHELLGFNPITITATSKGTAKVDITRGVDSWSVHCDLATGSFDNGVAGDVIYGLVPNNPRGYSIHLEPVNALFLPLTKQSESSDTYITSVRMRLTDQRNRPLSLNGEHITYRLMIRAKSRK